ncbi:monofunctional biosynthetic peptidoglycan transglycosylase [Nemorincola caseinilytica]|uniref:Monofunctional biosynthetic peptidoglycan transglycosylase n=1 Tax=Nemorincola caseinilytica TaxID=2054315 RepID=A0ABP8NMA3_9BACT
MAKGKRRIGRWILRALLVMFVSSTLYVVVCRWVWPPFTITQVAALFGGYGLKRDYVSWEKIPNSVKLAAIASEDQLFAEHGGFDRKALEKSVFGPQKKKKNKVRGGGASTISQQTAKNVFLWQGSGWGRYVRKVPEFYFTQLIEWTWGKKRIMEVYLNVIEMGPGIFGIEAAAQQYFHKPAKSLTQAEAAQIIACLPNPKKFTVRPMSRRVAWRYPRIVEQMNHLNGDEDIDDLLSR